MWELKKTHFTMNFNTVFFLKNVNVMQVYGMIANERPEVTIYNSFHRNLLYNCQLVCTCLELEAVYVKVPYYYQGK